MNDLTVKELAARERVGERTVRRWIEKGAVTIRRTPGGGIRIPCPELSRPAVFVMSNPVKSGHSSR
jgi:DNA binding domain, excisionase family